MAKTHHRGRLAAVVLASVAVTASGAAPAAADTPGPAPGFRGGGWERVVAEPFTSPAGDLCPFPVHSEPLVDRVYVRATATFPDGTPRRQEYAGPLVVRMTNTATGAAITRSLSGRATATYSADGGYDFSIKGRAAVGFRAYRCDSEPTGFYVLRGVHLVHFAADGTRTLTLDRGSEENVWNTLSWPASRNAPSRDDGRLMR